MHYKGQAAESGGNSLKIDFYILLFSKKMQNFELFRNPSFKFKETLMVHCTHEYLWKTTIKSLPELSSYIRKFSVYVAHIKFHILGTRLLAWVIQYPIGEPTRYGKYDSRVFSCGSTSSICQDVLKSDNLLHKRGSVDSQFGSSVSSYSLD